ncbi:MAG: hypothetical protein ABW252_12135 [Polyangiales bacterium]
MKRTLALLVGVLTLSTSAQVHAAPKKKKEAKVQEAPQSAQIATSMGELKWGMTRDQVVEHFTNQIRDKYKPLLAKSSGAIEEDKLRARQRDELNKMKSSLVEFNGKKTGWDVSFLKGEFTHHNMESLFVVTDDASENYYFFIQNKLWKWYKAFKTEAFEGKSFGEFAVAIQARYGKAVVREGEAVHGGGKQQWAEWQDANTRLRAVDNKQFYGFYSLVFEDKATLAKLASLRTSKVADNKKANALIEQVTSAEAAAETDGNPDVVDRITGKTRRRPENNPAPGSTGNKPGDAPKKPAPSETGGVTSDNDPLKGL